MDYLLFFIGIVLAGAGGELFVRGSVGIAHALRVSKGLVGATIIAFATSSPELTVSLTGALGGNPAVGLGDALGSNVVNVALILGLILLSGGIKASDETVRRDLLAALGAPILTGILLIDGNFSRIDGFILLGAFFLWFWSVLNTAQRQRKVLEEIVGERNVSRAGLESVSGLMMLFAAGKLIVMGASGIAAKFEVDPFVVGATIVSIGTSVPELATAAVARFRKHDEVGLGTILGSNLFNGLFLVGLVSSIAPGPAAMGEVIPSLALGFLSVALVIPVKGGKIGFPRGLLLLAVYSLYIYLMFEG